MTCLPLIKQSWGERLKDLPSRSIPAIRIGWQGTVYKQKIHLFYEQKGDLLSVNVELNLSSIFLHSIVKDIRMFVTKIGREQRTFVAHLCKGLPTTWIQTSGLRYIHISWKTVLLNENSLCFLDTHRKHKIPAVTRNSNRRYFVSFVNTFAGVCFHALVSHKREKCPRYVFR